VGWIPDGVIGHRGRYRAKKIQAGRSWVQFPVVSLDTEADIKLKKYKPEGRGFSSRWCHWTQRQIYN